MTMNSKGRCRTRAPFPVRRLALTGVALATLATAGGPTSAAGPERSLAGISIFERGEDVTRKFGNPNRILVGGVGASAAGTGTGSGPGGSGSPGASPAAGPSSGPNPGAGLLPGFAGVQSFGQALAGALGGEFPGAPGGPSGSPGIPTASAGPVAPPKQPVTLIYDRPNGGSLEFTISPDKRVIQIRETGYIGAYPTSRGIKLGTSYAQVVAHYGYPEDTYIQGSIISTDYKDTLHCGFQFLDQKTGRDHHCVAGLTVFPHGRPQRH